ncbi:spermidine synthase [Pseudoalteromonas tunicata D2]|uniref:Spermidine synthase n=1 Tax=Pseudoalteromonas tunicata D2 TaxID=87626 RepID=A4CFT3_9GAMM|nr:spermidine synthase [Pseudoalteromonas tunicata D2]
MTLIKRMSWPSKEYLLGEGVNGGGLFNA